MNISCSRCKERFNITEDQIYDYKKGIIFCCPECNEDIKIDPGALQQAINTTAQDLPVGDKLKKIILDSVETLPPMPQVAMKAQRIASNPDSGIAELARVIETDQAIATQVLKIANSAHYGAMSEVASVQKAGIVLGTKTLLEILTLACSSSLLGDKLMGYELDTGDLWMHSLTVAFCSRIIAQKYRPELEEVAFSAGLIHDSGKLILDPYIFERKKAFTEFINKNELSFLDAETAVLGFDHAGIASELCVKWQIPDNIADAIKYHHHPAKSQEKDLTYIVHISDIIAMMSGIGIGIDGLLYQADESALACLGISENDINIVICEAARYTGNIMNQI